MPIVDKKQSQKTRFAVDTPTKAPKTGNIIGRFLSHCFLWLKENPLVVHTNIIHQ